MKTITLDTFNAITKRSRESVTSKLEAFLNNEVSKLKINDIIEIEAKDFLDSGDDFHYYNASKMIKEKFNHKIIAKFLLKERGRADKLYVKKIA